MAKKDPESFPAGNRRERPHAEDGWNPPRGTGKPPVRPAGGGDDHAAGDPNRGKKA